MKCKEKIHLGKRKNERRGKEWMKEQKKKKSQEERNQEIKNKQKIK